MRQLLLELDAGAPQTLDNFVAGRNRELTALLAQFAAADAAPPERFVYLWGEN